MISSSPVELRGRRLPRAAVLVVRHEHLTPLHCATLYPPVYLPSTRRFRFGNSAYQTHNTKLHQIYQHTLPWDRLYSSSYLSHIFTHHCLELTPYRHTEVRLGFQLHPCSRSAQLAVDRARVQHLARHIEVSLNRLTMIDILNESPNQVLQYLHTLSHL